VRRSASMARLRERGRDPWGFPRFVAAPAWREDGGALRRSRAGSGGDRAERVDVAGGPRALAARCAGGMDLLRGVLSGIPCAEEAPLDSSVAGGGRDLTAMRRAVRAPRSAGRPGPPRAGCWKEPYNVSPPPCLRTPWPAPGGFEQPRRRGFFQQLARLASDEGRNEVTPPTSCRPRGREGPLRISPGPAGCLHAGLGARPPARAHAPHHRGRPSRRQSAPESHCH
jgi:hypothetical protein